jgi:hypothetical protein
MTPGKIIIPADITDMVAAVSKFLAKSGVEVSRHWP